MVPCGWTPADAPYLRMTQELLARIFPHYARRTLWRSSPRCSPPPSFGHRAPLFQNLPRLRFLGLHACRFRHWRRGRDAPRSHAFILHSGLGQRHRGCRASAVVPFGGGSRERRDRKGCHVEEVGRIYLGAGVFVVEYARVHLSGHDSPEARRG